MITTATDAIACDAGDVTKGGAPMRMFDDNTIPGTGGASARSGLTPVDGAGGVISG